MTKSEKLLSELIALPSVNPAFLPPNDPLAGEARVAEFIAATAASAGLDIEFQNVLPERSNILARLSPSGKASGRILLAPHLDTVNAGPEGFRPRKKTGRFYGRGACDTKGSVAAMLSALIEVASNGRRPDRTEIVFAGLVDEENAQGGSRALVRDGFNADLAIVGEPTLARVVTAHKGDLWLQLESRGKSAHGSLPHLGVNAVHVMARAVDAIETDYAAWLKKRRHPLLGFPTVSVGFINGGTQPNIVPDRCVASVDRRTLPGETSAGVTNELRGFFATRRLDVSVSSEKTASCDPMETDSRLPLVRSFMRVTGQRRPIGMHFFCDAAVLSEGGIPSVVFGPGDIAQAHKPDEWISIESLHRAKDFLVKFLRALP